MDCSVEVGLEGVVGLAGVEEDARRTRDGVEER